MGKWQPYYDYLHYEDRQPAEATEEAKLVAEIAWRLREYYEKDEERCTKLIETLANTCRAIPKSFTLMLTCLTGSREELKSYAQLAEERGTSKQYQHAQRKRDMEKLAKTHPEIVEALQGLLWK